MKTKKAKSFPQQKLLLVSIITLLVGGIGGYLIRGQSSNQPAMQTESRTTETPPTGEAELLSPTATELTGKMDPKIEAEIRNQAATEITGDITIHKGSYDSALVNIGEMNGRIIVLPIDSEYFTDLQKGGTYNYHFLRLDPSKTYGIIVTVTPKGKQSSSTLQVTDCSGQIHDGGFSFCSTTAPGKANFSD